jgi:hypothetical protein
MVCCSIRLVGERNSGGSTWTRAAAGIAFVHVLFIQQSLSSQLVSSGQPPDKDRRRVPSRGTSSYLLPRRVGYQYYP